MDPGQADADGREVLVEREADRPVARSRRGASSRAAARRRPTPSSRGRRGRRTAARGARAARAGLRRRSRRGRRRRPGSGRARPRSRRRPRRGPSGRPTSGRRARGRSRQPSQHALGVASTSPASVSRRTPMHVGAVESSNAACEPAMTATFASASASRAEAARTVAWTTSVRAGSRVAGSIRWCDATPAIVQRWTLVPEVAMPSVRPAVPRVRVVMTARSASGRPRIRDAERPRVARGDTDGDVAVGVDDRGRRAGRGTGRGPRASPWRRRRGRSGRRARARRSTPRASRRSDQRRPAAVGGVTIESPQLRREPRVEHRDVDAPVRAALRLAGPVEDGRERRAHADAGRRARR